MNLLDRFGKRKSNLCSGSLPIVTISFAISVASIPSHAEEGMWTFDNLPVKQLQDKYHLANAGVARSRQTLLRSIQ
jgi:hypothetical protein